MNHFNKFALVVGNNNYQTNPLDKAVADAESVASILEYKKFDVTLSVNLNSQKLSCTFYDFTQKIKNGNNVVLFYFAGHGNEINNENFLLPINDFDDNDIKYEALSLTRIQDELTEFRNKINIIILDCCRNNPRDYLITSSAKKNRSFSKSINAKSYEKIFSCKDTLIAFSTSPGLTALEGPKHEKNSLYTAALFRNLKKYNLTIEEMFRNVREEVVNKSGFRQIPWEHSSLSVPFSFDDIEIPRKFSNFLDAPWNNMLSISISADGKHIAATGEGPSSSNVIKIWRYQTPHSWNVTIDHGDCQCECVRYSPTGNYLAASTNDGFVYFYDLKDQPKVTPIKAHDSGIFTIAFNCDGNLLATACCNKIKIWCTKKFIKIKEFSIGEGTIYSLSFHPHDADRLAVGGSEGLFNIWDIENEINTLDTDNETIEYFTYAIQFSPNGNYVATAHNYGMLSLWDTKENKLIWKKCLHREIQSLEFIAEYKAESSEIPNRNLHSLCFNSNGTVIAAGSNDSSIEFWDVAQGELIKEHRLGTSVQNIWALSFMPNCNQLVTNGRHRKVYIFEP